MGGNYSERAQLIFETDTSDGQILMARAKVRLL
jgi:hypothetical protein